MLVEYTKPNLLTCWYSNHYHFSFKPGVNEIPNEVWDQCKAKRKIKLLLEEGVLRVETEAEIDEEASAISELTVAKATTIIKKTYDEKLLETWLASDSRQGVIKAIKAQQRFIDEQTNPNRDAV